MHVYKKRAVAEGKGGNILFYFSLWIRKRSKR
jgi:hypothetical protein